MFYISIVGWLVYTLQIGVYMIYLAYVAIASFIFPAKVVPGVIMQDGTRLYYRCNGLTFSIFHFSSFNLFSSSVKF